MTCPFCRWRAGAFERSSAALLYRGESKGGAPIPLAAKYRRIADSAGGIASL